MGKIIGKITNDELFIKSLSSKENSIYYDERIKEILKFLAISILLIVCAIHALIRSQYFDIYTILLLSSLIIAVSISVKCLLDIYSYANKIQRLLEDKID